MIINPGLPLMSLPLGGGRTRFMTVLNAPVLKKGSVGSPISIIGVSSALFEEFHAGYLSFATLCNPTCVDNQWTS